MTPPLQLYSDAEPWPTRDVRSTPPLTVTSVVTALKYVVTINAWINETVASATGAAPATAVRGGSCGSSETTVRNPER